MQLSEEKHISTYQKDRIINTYCREKLNISRQEYEKIISRGENEQTFVDHNLDKLAQLRKSADTNELRKLKRAGKTSLLKKNNAKYFTRVLNRELMKLDTPLNNYYSLAYKCNDLQMQSGKKLTSRYCNTRTCVICNRVRTAKAINGYGEQLMKLDKPIFLTLTRINVPANELREEIREMLSVFKKIVDIYRKRSEKDLKQITEIPKKRNEKESSLFWVRNFTGEISDNYYNTYKDKLTPAEYREKLRKLKKEYYRPLTGLRKLECEYNASTKEFNPHFHFIVEGGMSRANEIIKMWIEKCKGKAGIKGQKAISATPGALKELFKYTTKMISSENEFNHKKRRKIQIYALDTIIQATYGQRTFQTFGDLRRVSEEVEQINAQDYENLEPTHGDSIVCWYYNDNCRTWIDLQTGELLTNYEPGKWLEFILLNPGRDTNYSANRKIKPKKRKYKSIAISPESILKHKIQIAISCGNIKKGCFNNYPKREQLTYNCLFI